MFVLFCFMCPCILFQCNVTLFLQIAPVLNHQAAGCFNEKRPTGGSFPGRLLENRRRRGPGASFQWMVKCGPLTKGSKCATIMKLFVLPVSKWVPESWHFAINLTSSRQQRRMVRAPHMSHTETHEVNHAMVRSWTTFNVQSRFNNCFLLAGFTCIVHVLFPYRRTMNHQQETVASGRPSKYLAQHS